MRTVELPGGTCELRDQAEIKVKHKRLVEAAAVAAAPVFEKARRLAVERNALMTTGRHLAEATDGEVDISNIDFAALGLTAQEATRTFELQDAIIVASLASWTLEGPLPTLDTIGDLDPALYEVLSDATSQFGAAMASKVDFDPGDPKDPGFEETPTVPSDDSEGTSKDTEAVGESTEQPPSDGESTGSAPLSLVSPTTTT